MRIKFFKSFSARLSLRYMFVLTIAVVLLSVFFLLFTRSLVNKNQRIELEISEKTVFRSFEEYRASAEDKADFMRTLDSIPGMPYYIT